MNVQNAINAGLVLEFVYNNWQATGADGLNGLPVTLSQPCSPPATYKVARTIYSCDLATDITPQAPGNKGWKIIGMLAFNEEDVNDVFIAIRGTENVWEYIQDFKFFPKPFSNVPGAGLTDDGFTDMYQSRRPARHPALARPRRPRAALAGSLHIRQPQDRRPHLSQRLQPHRAQLLPHRQPA
jgi:hypothetical protein